MALFWVQVSQEAVGGACDFIRGHGLAGVTSYLFRTRTPRGTLQSKYRSAHSYLGTFHLACIIAAYHKVDIMMDTYLESTRF